MTSWKKKTASRLFLHEIFRVLKKFSLRIHALSRPDPIQILTLKALSEVSTSQCSRNSSCPPTKSSPFQNQEGMKSKLTNWEITCSNILPPLIFRLMLAPSWCSVSTTVWGTRFCRSIISLEVNKRRKNLAKTYRFNRLSLSLAIVNSNVLEPLKWGWKVLSRSEEKKAHLVPNGWLRLYAPFGSLKFPPAVSLPLLAQLPPRMEGLLEQEQQAAATEVEEHCWKHDRKQHIFPTWWFLLHFWHQSGNQSNRRSYQVEPSKKKRKEGFPTLVSLVPVLHSSDCDGEPHVRQKVHQLFLQGEQVEVCVETRLEKNVGYPADENRQHQEKRSAGWGD